MQSVEKYFENMNAQIQVPVFI
jgi:hypothetical protein